MISNSLGELLGLIAERFVLLSSLTLSMRICHPAQSTQYPESRINDNILAECLSLASEFKHLEKVYLRARIIFANTPIKPYVHDNVDSLLQP